MPLLLRRYLFKLVAFLRGLLVLTSIYLLGNWLGGFITFPVPGAVIGMVIVFVFLKTGLLPLEWVDSASVILLSFMGLFYVPYGVGIVNSSELIGNWGGHILIIMSVTVMIVFTWSAWLFRKLSKPSHNDHK